MRWFNVHAITATNADTLAEVQWETLDEVTELYSGAWGAHPDRSVSARLSIQARDIREATEQAFLIIPQALARVGVPSTEITALEAMSEDRSDQWLNTPLIPEIVGVAEAAQICGVSEQATRKAAEAGKFGAIKVGRTWIFPGEDADRDTVRRRRLAGHHGRR